MVFVKAVQFTQRIPCYFNSSSIQELKESLEQVDIPTSQFVFCHQGKRLDITQDGQLRNDDVIHMSLPILGGKGGFGSMLRALGAQIEKTTNKEACRDLSGRRLRDINEEDRLKKYVAKQSERDHEKRERKAAKMEKLKRLAKGESKHEFHDPKYDAERELATERVHDAVEQAMASSKATIDDSSKASTSGIGQKRKSGHQKNNIPRKKSVKGDFWLGVEINNSDVDSTDSED